MDAPQENDNAGVKIPPPFIYGAFFLIGTMLQYVFPIPALLPNTIAWPIGWALAVASLFFVIPGMRSFRATHNPIVPYKPISLLITTGVFKTTRNPLYLSLLLVYGGISIFINFWWPIAITPLLIITVNRFVIAKEEAYLARRFGEEYRGYRERVRRWI